MPENSLLLKRLQKSAMNKDKDVIIRACLYFISYILVISSGNFSCYLTFHQNGDSLPFTLETKGADVFRCLMGTIAALFLIFLFYYPAFSPLTLVFLEHLVLSYYIVTVLEE